MSLSRMKSWLLGYTIELCCNLDIIRLFIKAAEHSNQSRCFAFLNVLLYVNLCYGFPFFSSSTDPTKGKGQKMRWDEKLLVPPFQGVLCPEGSYMWQWFWELGCSTSSSYLFVLRRTRRRPFWKEQPLVLVCDVKLKQKNKPHKT